MQDPAGQKPDSTSPTSTPTRREFLYGLEEIIQGLFKKIRDLGLPLLSVNPVEPDAPREGDAAHDPTPKE